MNNRKIALGGIAGVALSAFMFPNWMPECDLKHRITNYKKYITDKPYVNKIKKHVTCERDLMCIEDRLMSGKDFNKLYSSTGLVVFTDKFNYFDPAYYIQSSNVDERPIKTRHNNAIGGIEFTNTACLEPTIMNHNPDHAQVYKVKVPNNAYVYVDCYSKYTANKLILEPCEHVISSINDFYDFFDS